ncbi:hypothetical protein ACG98H_06865 [Corynebacterium sp. L4756]|uniref:hypothetical protein n=1 Tax=unclassified Corynebacterium TaxID=2624378 RepID=UPI00374C9EF4
MSSNFIPFEFSRGEAIGGMVWLTVGALLSLVLEVVYLGAYITVPNGLRIAIPITILIAWWFNRVLSKTAKLWTAHPLIAAIPVIAWVLGFFALLVWGQVGGDQLLGSNIRTVALLFAGIIGGVWPFVVSK